jgi:hypothetical protein
MGNRVSRVASTALLIALFVAASSPLAMAQGMPPSASPIEPGAGAWRTWVLTSGKDLRLPRLSRSRSPFGLP